MSSWELRRAARDARREARRQARAEKIEKGEKGGPSGDRAGPLLGGLVLVWLGVSFYLAQSGTVSWSNWWAYFIIGLGVIVIFQGVVHYSQSRRPFAGFFIGGAVLILVGVFFVESFAYDFWPLILIVIGAAVIISGLTERRRSPAL
jgi:LiaF transmembrane domain